ncbi:protein ANTAGONIST OF LIKE HETEROCHROMATIN PROTEIN 1-like [Ischnura elegans]|uniref:protein ANTAGONIST OF LIKE HETEROCHROMATIN PROTEIN 1-like n=1 Tax=Ischnura elegans TaxID=197161 RepID=UPI001ED885B5|nr:protein ANTAGONIST OF LIKE HETEROCHROMATIN PROTEIN 1-like [Ischnura elegans]
MGHFIFAEDLFSLIEAHEGRALKLYVYNTQEDACCEVTITPNSGWGGEGRREFLGDAPAGYLSVECGLADDGSVGVSGLGDLADGDSGRHCVCSHSGKGFGKSNQLLCHVRTHHSGELPFACGNCGRRYVKASDLTQHAKSHSAVKPHRFLEEKNFPGILGAIDCTHVKIKAPHVNDEVYPEHLYVNRHGYHSINVQLVIYICSMNIGNQICDYDLNILNVNARYPGGTHDSFIWRSSNIYRALENAHSVGTLDGWLIGDSGYPLQPWLMTPVLNAIPGTPENRYTEAHAAARNCIERCNGVLKSRF